MSKNADFSETSFSQVNDVGLSVYAVYVFCFENGEWHYETNFVSYEIFW